MDRFPAGGQRLELQVRAPPVVTCGKRLFEVSMAGKLRPCHAEVHPKTSCSEQGRTGKPVD